MGNQNTDLSRRKFLATSLGCLVTAGAYNSPSAVLPAESAATETANTGATPVVRKLGRTGIEVPIVSAGGGPVEDPGLVQACFETGMRLFDTDARYRGGRHEELLGRVFKRLGIREKVVIVTKVLPPELRRGARSEHSKTVINKTLEGSLSRLKTDYIDVLMIQDVSDAETARDPVIIEALTRVKEQGKARFIGIAAHAGMTRTITAMVDVGVYDVVLTAVNCTMADDTALLDAISAAAAKGIGVIAMKTQAGGYAFPNPTTLRDFSVAVINSAALKWVCHNENIATAAPGMNNYQHLRANFSVALNPAYTDLEKKFLSDNRIRLGLEFCRQCRQCLAACPDKVDIPTLMRTHMYIKQYADLDLARQTLDSIGGPRRLDACKACSPCRAECVNSVNIPRKIEELKFIFA